MVFTINEGIRRKLFSLRPGDNRWPSAKIPTPDASGNGIGKIFEFKLPNGLPVCAYISDSGRDKISVHAAVLPTSNMVKASNGGIQEGEAIANTWLERRPGAWMQSACKLFTCRRSLLQILADLAVEPLGYGDKGPVVG